ncbi:hypothetical protein C8R46DRAFT_1125570 [Mycena filopes]|nr:hypothetical protein C8R46DRAFT_1125570 [Mycena filopes]
MPPSIFHLLCCCLRPELAPEDDPTVIPTETSHLLASSALSSPGLPEATAVDHQEFHDRMGTIVRSKEGKMVNLNARVPFTLQTVPPTSNVVSSESEPSSSLPTPTSTGPPAADAEAAPSRHPPVLTMTPARSRLYAESRYSSPSGSRSSSRRRPELSNRHTYHASGSGPASAIEGSGAGRARQGSFVETSASESEPESALESERRNLPAGVGIASNAKSDENPAMSIAFSWSDT